jgi:cystathionine beta-lyase
MRFATRAIHAGQEPDELTGAVNVPVYLTATYKQDAVGRPRRGYEYARTQNPTRASLETTIASLENARHGLCFASGSAATAAVLDLLKPGDEVVSTIDVYGGTYRLLRQVYEKYGIRSRFLATSDAPAIARAAGDGTRMIWIETPTNPMLNVIDVAAVARARPDGALLVVDNTFATPALQTPMDLGADIVVHSSTKYLGGHSDVVQGAVVTNDARVHEACKFYQNAAGATPGPLDCFLVQRGLKTLEIRMERHGRNASAVARLLRDHPAVARVHFPGRPEHPNHEVASRQMRGPGGMVSFTLRGGRAAVDRFFSRLRVFYLAESLGGVESLACHPTTMTHHAIPEADKTAIGITDDLVRLSVGIEAEEDLLEDLEQALRS